MNRRTQKNFLIYLENECEEELLFRCRLVCKIWNNYIQSRPFIHEWIIRQREIKKSLEYDKKVYDEYSYKRDILSNMLALVEEEYKQLSVPGIQIGISDLDEDESMVYVLDKALPLDMRIFLCEYFKSPNVIVKLYSPAFFRSVSESQAIILRKFLINDEKSLENIMLFSPICYSKHYKKRAKDQQCMNILCYINIVDETIGINFPSEDERYIVFELPLDDLKDEKSHHEILKNFLIEKTLELQQEQNSIVEISQNVQCIRGAFDTALQNHHYNL